MLSVWIFDSPVSSSQWWDVSGSLVSVSVSTHERGYLECVLTISVDAAMARAMIAGGGTPWVEVTDNGAPVWSGRIERIGRVDGAAVLYARGAYSAVTDRTHTAIYAMSKPSAFKPIEINLDSTFNPSFWDVRIQNGGITIAPRKGETHGGSVNRGGAYFVCPFGGYNGITNIQFSYSFTAPAGWYLRVHTYTYNAGAALTYVGSPYSLNGNGANQSGSQSLSFSSVGVVAFVIDNTNAPAALAVDTGVYFLNIAGVFVSSGSSSPTTADVVSGAIGQVALQNPSQINSTIALITAAESVTDAVYQNADVQDILSECAQLGDGSNGLVEYGIYDDRTLFYAPMGANARTWYIDDTALEIERGFEDVWNSIRSMYTDSFGHVVVSSVAEDSLSISHWGIYRARRFETGLNSLAAANDHANTTIEQTSAVVPSARGLLRAVFDEFGLEFPLYSVRAGDLLAVRSLEYGDSVDGFNYFRIAQTKYGATIGAESLTIELQSSNASSAAFVSAATASPTTVSRPPIVAR